MDTKSLPTTDAALAVLLSDEERAVLYREAIRTGRTQVGLAIAILQRECHAICAREALARGDEPAGPYHPRREEHAPHLIRNER